MHSINSNNIIVFAAQHAVVDIHYHMCFQMVVSTRTPFDSTINGETHTGIMGFLVNQKIPHHCQAKGTEVLVFFIDAESFLGWQLKELLDGRPFLDIASLLSPEQLNGFVAAWAKVGSVDEMRKLSDELLEELLALRSLPKERAMDDRMIKILEYVDTNRQEPLLLEDIGRLVFLSPERVRHLFVQETGIPFSQYLLWKRIKAVLTQVIGEKAPMIDAILENGFSDQPHFTHLFKRTFGVSAKLLLKNSRYVQFLKPQV